MKSKLLLVMFTLMTCLLAQRSDAQTRYADSVFASYTVDSVTYSTPYNLKMNIYQPVGDGLAKRPLVILAHGGSFVAGDRYSDVAVTHLCEDLAHKGYVTVSIDYRLTGNPGNLLSADSAVTEVFEAVGDGKAAVRYFYKDAWTTNTYKIDTDNIYVGGNSAGAVLFMHYAYLDDTMKFSPLTNFNIIAHNVGGLDGLSGNPGYSTKIKGVINLAGGLNDASWLSYCSKPVVSAQGDSDMVVPYICNQPYVYGFHVPLTLCGLGSLQALITRNTPYSESMVFPGDGHVPWESDPAKMYRVDTMVTTFLFKEVTGTAPTACRSVAGINEASASDFVLYPNPATNVLNIHSSAFISDITVMDQTGRTVAQASNLNTLSYQMNTSNLSSGVYFVRVSNTQDMTSSVKKIVIE